MSVNLPGRVLDDDDEGVLLAKCRSIFPVTSLKFIFPFIWAKLFHHKIQYTVKFNRPTNFFQSPRTNMSELTFMNEKVNLERNCPAKTDDDGHLNNFITQLLAVDYGKRKCSESEELEDHEEVPSDEEMTKKVKLKNETDTSGPGGTIVNSESRIGNVSVDANHVYDVDFIRNSCLKKHKRMHRKAKTDDDGHLNNFITQLLAVDYGKIKCSESEELEDHEEVPSDNEKTKKVKVQDKTDTSAPGATIVNSESRIGNVSVDANDVDFIRNSCLKKCKTMHRKDNKEIEQVPDVAGRIKQEQDYKAKTDDDGHLNNFITQLLAVDYGKRKCSESEELGHHEEVLSDEERTKKVKLRDKTDTSAPGRTIVNSESRIGNVSVDANDVDFIRNSCQKKHKRMHGESPGTNMSQLTFMNEKVNLEKDCHDPKEIEEVPDLTGRIKQEQDYKTKIDDDGYLNNFITQLLAVDYVKKKCSKNEELGHPGLCGKNEEVPSDEVMTRTSKIQDTTETSGPEDTTETSGPEDTTETSGPEMTIANSESIIPNVSLDANGVDADLILSNNLKKCKRIHSEVKPYKCNICQAGFSQSSDLNRHKIIHTGEKPYKCDNCGVGFAHSSNLQKHKRIHTGEKPYKCDVCELAFTKSYHLKRHTILHTGEKPYKCDICDKVFAQVSSLNTHVSIHTGERRYKCDVCGLGFTENSNLQRHKRIHTGEKPYKCDVCGVGFAQSSDLKGHKRMHAGEKPYKCDVCDVGFSKSYHLKRHKRIHTGEKPYKCDDCGVGFAHNNSLNLHRRLHTGEKPYKCDVCGLSFLRDDYLRMHKRKHIQ